MAAQIATFITQKQNQHMSAESLGTSTVDMPPGTASITPSV